MPCTYDVVVHGFQQQWSIFVIESYRVLCDNSTVLTRKPFFFFRADYISLLTFLMYEDVCTSTTHAEAVRSTKYYYYHTKQSVGVSQRKKNCHRMPACTGQKKKCTPSRSAAMTKIAHGLRRKREDYARVSMYAICACPPGVVVLRRVQKGWLAKGEGRGATRRGGGCSGSPTGRVGASNINWTKPDG